MDGSPGFASSRPSPPNHIFRASMIDYDRKNWIKAVSSFRGTASRHAAGRILAMTTYAVVLQAIYQTAVVYNDARVKSLFTALEPAAHAMLGTFLGFLLVFRMNASNNRYWEGRTAWGQIINASRNLVRVGVAYTDNGRTAGRSCLGLRHLPAPLVARQLRHGRDRRFPARRTLPPRRAVRQPAHGRGLRDFRMDRDRVPARRARFAVGAPHGRSAFETGRLPKAPARKFARRRCRSSTS